MMKSNSDVAMVVKLLFEDGTPYKMVSNLTSSSKVYDLVKHFGADFDILTQDGFVVSDPTTPVAAVASHAPSTRPSSVMSTLVSSNAYYVKLRSKTKTTAAVQLFTESPDSSDLQQNGKLVDTCYNLKPREKLQVISNCGLIFARCLGDSPVEASLPLFRLVSDGVGDKHFRFRSKLIEMTQISRNKLTSNWTQQGFGGISIDDIIKMPPVFEMNNNFLQGIANLDDSDHKSDASVASDASGSSARTAFAKKLHQRAVIYINEGLVEYDAHFLAKLDAILSMSDTPNQAQIRSLRQLEQQYGTVVVTEASVGAEIGVKAYFQKTQQQSEQNAIWEAVTSLQVDVLKGASAGAPITFEDSDGDESARKLLYVRGGEPLVATMGNISKWLRTIGKHQNWVLLEALKLKPWYFMLDSNRKQKVTHLIDYMTSMKSDSSLNNNNNRVSEVDRKKFGELALLQKKKDESVLSKATSDHRQLPKLKRLNMKDLAIGVDRDDLDVDLDDVDIQLFHSAGWRPTTIIANTASDPMDVVLERGKRNVHQVRVVDSSSGELDAGGHFETASIFVMTSFDTGGSYPRIRAQFESTFSRGKYLRILEDDDGKHIIDCGGHSRGRYTWFWIKHDGGLFLDGRFRFESVEHRGKYIRAKRIGGHPRVDVGNGGAKCVFDVYKRIV